MIFIFGFENMDDRFSHDEIHFSHYHDCTLSKENLSSGFPNRSDTKTAMQPQKMARGLKIIWL